MAVGENKKVAFDDPCFSSADSDWNYFVAAFIYFGDFASENNFSAELSELFNECRNYFFEVVASDVRICFVSYLNWSSRFDELFKNEVLFKGYAFCPAREFSVAECSGSPFAEAVAAQIVKNACFFKLRDTFVSFSNFAPFFDDRDLKTCLLQDGTGCGRDFDITKRRYGKLVIATDSDVEYLQKKFPAL